jgi:hypothetical protein
MRLGPTDDNGHAAGGRLEIRALGARYATSFFMLRCGRLLLLCWSTNAIQVPLVTIGFSDWAARALPFKAASLEAHFDAGRKCRIVRLDQGKGKAKAYNA